MRTINISSKITGSYPEQRVWAFSPNRMIVNLTSDFAENAEVTISMNGYTQKRNCINRTCTFILDVLFQSYFKGVDFSVLGTTTPTMVFDKSLTISATQTDTTVISGSLSPFDIIWGALQQGETESTAETIYRFGTLPLTITQTIGDNWRDTANTYSGTTNYGKHIDIQTLTEDGYPYDILLRDNTTIKKTYILSHSSCTDGVYFRWIDSKGEYKYYLLQQASDETSSKNGSSFKHYLTSTTDLRNKDQLISKTASKSIQCGVQTADDTITAFLRGCQQSLKHWAYINSQWIEMVLEDSNIATVRLEPLRQIDFKFRFSDNYTQSL